MGTGAGGNFNWIAPVYDALAFIVFGHKLQQAQAVFLNRIPTGASVLIVGGGTGWLLEQVLRRCQSKRIVYLETSTQMVARASRRMVQKALVGSVEFRVGDESSLKPDERFDVILTPFVLDLFSAQTLQTTIIPQLRTVLKSGGLWLATDFVKPPSNWQKALLWVMIRFFRLTAGIQAQHLADWQKLLSEAGLRCEKRQTEVGGMVSAEVWGQVD
ncbi:class I SAM-dependent methyltransferase [Spirosoma sp. KCTC 42546]|uniref:class I SAM-dependent methyltransferase n=1 Tax=Spirosoma sp. KCTC 42546 TaxID=2520506 RepID=UPI00115A4C66|nr:class I SAM-dependent methyltransferase [Spirosoma sp. KCTC 42546]QDK80378.1 class I SAM-dependent methyltransferase [Spirosoma sp. KCTC 42546]